MRSKDTSDLYIPEMLFLYVALSIDLLLKVALILTLILARPDEPSP